MKAVAANDAFRTELAELAVKHGIDLTQGELSDDELDAVAGGGFARGSVSDLLASVGDNAQLANIDLQNVLQKQQQTLQTMSNVSKMLHDTSMTVIRNIS